MKVYFVPEGDNGNCRIYGITLVSRFANVLYIAKLDSEASKILSWVKSTFLVL